MRGHHLWQNDWALRACGLFAMLIGALTIRQLFSLEHIRPRHEASAIEASLAAIGFVGFFGGSALVSLGAHIFDEIQVASRWSRRSFDAPPPSTRFPELPHGPEHSPTFAYASAQSFSHAPHPWTLR